MWRGQVYFSSINIAAYGFAAMFVVQGRLLIIPGIWSLIGGSAAFLLGISPDWPLLVSGVMVIPLLFRQGIGIRLNLKS